MLFSELQSMCSLVNFYCAFWIASNYVIFGEPQSMLSLASLNLCVLRWSSIYVFLGQLLSMWSLASFNLYALWRTGRLLAYSLRRRQAFYESQSLICLKRHLIVLYLFLIFFSYTIFILTSDIFLYLLETWWMNLAICIVAFSGCPILSLSRMSEVGS